MGLRRGRIQQTSHSDGRDEVRAFEEVIFMSTTTEDYDKYMETVYGVHKLPCCGLGVVELIGINEFSNPRNDI